MNLTSQKREIVQWINSIEDPKIIEQINSIRKEKIAFEVLLKDCISAEEVKKRTTAFIESLPWKK